MEGFFEDDGFFLEDGRRCFGLWGRRTKNPHLRPSHVKNKEPPTHLHPSDPKNEDPPPISVIRARRTKNPLCSFLPTRRTQNSLPHLRSSQSNIGSKIVIGPISDDKARMRGGARLWLSCSTPIASTTTTLDISL